MDVSEEDYKLEDTQKAESKTFGDLVKETISDENSKSAEETLDGDDEYRPDENSPRGLVSEKLEEDETGLDHIIKSEPSLDLTNIVVSLSEVFPQAAKEPVQDSMEEINGVSGAESIEINGVFRAGMDSASKGIDSLSGQNGDSPIVINAVSKGIEPASDENDEVSSAVIESAPAGTDGNPEEDKEDEGAADLVSRTAANIPPSADFCGGVDASNVGKDSHTPEVPESTENQDYIAVTPRPLHRTSWSGCCGLFEFLRRFDQ